MSNAIHRDSPFAAFETDPSVERDGIKLDYGAFYFRVARAGGANSRFRDVLRQRMAPHKRAVATETMNDDLADKISIDVFAETVILGWGRPAKDKDGKPTGKDEEGVITWRDGTDRDYSVDSVKELFRLLPDLARDVMVQAQSAALFRSAIADIDAGN